MTIPPTEETLTLGPDGGGNTYTGKFAVTGSDFPTP
jgi:hypothetical protein